MSKNIEKLKRYFYFLIVELSREYELSSGIIAFTDFCYKLGGVVYLWP